MGSRLLRLFAALSAAWTAVLVAIAAHQLTDCCKPAGMLTITLLRSDAVPDEVNAAVSPAFLTLDEAAQAAVIAALARRTGGVGAAAPELTPAQREIVATALLPAPRNSYRSLARLIPWLVGPIAWLYLLCLL